MIALVDYGAGNTASVSNVLNELNTEFILTNKEDEINSADKIILPGVGEASSAISSLRKLGLIEILRTSSKPFLGICLGMQLLCNKTEEGNTDCLQIIPIDVMKFKAENIKVPHMGWNKIALLKDTTFSSINGNEYFYFAHSFFVPVNEFTTSTCEYCTTFSASIRFNNFYGVQFHPEKSAHQGTQFIKNFLTLC